jgi:hypothetical protein
MKADRATEPFDFGVDPLERALSQLRGPVHWPSLTRAEAASRMEELDGWVRSLVARFCIESRTLPPCWGRHPAMVEVLSALRDHERASYADTASPTSAMDWLRALRDAQLLLADVAARTQCSIHEHRDQAIPPWAADQPATEASSRGTTSRTEIDA